MSIYIHEELRPYLVPIESISQHPDNPNSGDVDAIADSILVNGFYNPLIVQASTGYILAGNHRYAAMLKLGEPAVPVVRVDVDDATALKILIVDNRTAELSERDPRALETILKQLAIDEDLLGTGYMEEDLGDLMRANRAFDHMPINADGGYSAPAAGGMRSTWEVRIVVTATLDEEGHRHPMRKDEAEDLVEQLKEMGFEARGEYLG